LILLGSGGDLKSWPIGKSKDKRGDRFELNKLEILTLEESVLYLGDDKLKTRD